MIGWTIEEDIQQRCTKFSFLIPTKLFVEGNGYWKHHLESAFNNPNSVRDLLSALMVLAVVEENTK